MAVVTSALVLFAASLIGAVLGLLLATRARAWWIRSLVLCRRPLKEPAIAIDFYRIASTGERARSAWEVFRGRAAAVTEYHWTTPQAGQAPGEDRVETPAA